MVSGEYQTSEVENTGFHQFLLRKILTNNSNLKVQIHNLKLKTSFEFYFIAINFEFCTLN